MFHKKHTSSAEMICLFGITYSWEAKTAQTVLCTTVGLGDQIYPHSPVLPILGVSERAFSLYINLLAISLLSPVDSHSSKVIFF